MSRIKRDEALELRRSEHCPPDLDVEVYRKVMGGKPQKHYSDCYQGGRRWQELIWTGPREGRDSWEGIPCYSTSIAAAWDVEEHIAALGLQHAYGAELAAAVSPDPFFFGLIHATPAQRCRAALLAVNARAGVAEAGEGR